MFLHFANCNNNHEGLFKEEKHILSNLSKSEISRYWENRKLHESILNQYVNTMSLVNNEGILTRESIEEFCYLFQSNAKVLNDIHPVPFLTEPMDYALFVKTFIKQGVNSEIKHIENYSATLDKRLLKYYEIGKGTNEFYLHTAIQKTIFYGLDSELQIVSYGTKGKAFLLDFITYINNETNEIKIADIKPLLN